MGGADGAGGNDADRSAGGPTSGQDEPGPAVGQIDGVLDPTIPFLAERRQISLEEAERRLRQQESVLDAFEVSEAEIAGLDGFGGIWVDSTDRVVVGTTDDATAARIRELLGEDARLASFVTVEYTMRHLEAVAAELVEHTNDLDEELRRAFSVGIDTQINSVVVELPPSAEGKPNALADAALGRAEVTISWTGVPSEQYYCTYAPYCEPMRAGQRLIPSPPCTAGFYVRSQSDNKPYMLTAGHCREAMWRSYKYATGPFDVGPTHNYYVGGVGDFSIIRINNPLGWGPQPWVMVFDTLGAGTTENHFYPIRSLNSNPVGASVCKTGTTSKTTCGVILATGVTASLGGSIVGNLARTDFCGSPGDSGGPVYRFNGANGLVAGGSTGPCRTYYSGASTAMAYLNVYLVTAP